MTRFTFIYLGSFFLLITVLSFFNIIYSYYFNLFLNVNTYLYTLFISLTLSLLYLMKKKDEIKITIYHKILTVILGYFLIPLVISIPYYLSIYNMSFLNAYFEAISGFTSTGFTVFENIKHLDQSLILWRSTSQWLGGLYFLFSIILLINIFDDNLKKSLTNFLSFDTSETLKQSLKIFILYSILTLIIFLLFKLINLRTFDAFNLSFSIISSGGFLPFNSIDNILNTELKRIVFSMTMLISFFSLFLSYNVFFIKEKSLHVFSEDFYLFVYFIFLIILFFIIFNFEYSFSIIFFSITSSISNIGISFNHSNNNLSFIFLILVIIGGSFFSTSSGIRFIKLFTLARFSFNELLSHTRPKQIYISKITFAENQINQLIINKYFLSLVIFIISLFCVSFLLTLTNFDAQDAFKIGILTIMNTVNSDMFNLAGFNFDDISFFSKLILIFFMIIGRVELLTIFILSKKFLFKN